MTKPRHGLVVTQHEAISIDGEQHYVCIMSPFQEHDLRIADANGWLDIQKAAAAAEGAKNPIFTGGELLYRGVIIKEIPELPVISGVGNGGADVAVGFLCGRQALAWGLGQEMKAIEDTSDYEFRRGHEKGGNFVGRECPGIESRRVEIIEEFVP